MVKIKFGLFLFVLFSFQLINAQTIEILGRVESTNNVENIHVINKSLNQFTITNVVGEFKVLVRLNDTLQFSSIQHKPKSIIITPNIINLKALKVYLEEQVNELDEVMVGSILTGDLLSDVQNVNGKPPINFYDVGIPGYTGKPATQSERRLSEASNFSPSVNGNSMGGGGSVSILPIINAITGRTKMLKKRVKIEEKEEVMLKVKGRLAKDFFISNPLNSSLQADFFYFCADDENFIKYCKNKSDFEVLIFLRHKYKQYLKNLCEVEK
ncbi:hypothetical protein PW52_08770 [Tamlana sedimentorum]|uniref:TonB-dependent receptor n=1 Tax=Neotamlana sedimentorum TaxID=1435349 RepID=A0A0D7W9P4_9FLAO|nr:hypothetical protein [Tamlana sedimentorum]KJD35814.1 hypothetical protein PW52_08770 [Tamlana sedimentorum]